LRSDLAIRRIPVGFRSILRKGSSQPNLAKSLLLAAVAKANNKAAFLEAQAKGTERKGSKGAPLSLRNTPRRSHVGGSERSGGLSLNTPRRRRESNTCSPTRAPSTGSWYEEMAERYPHNVEYFSPFLYNELRKFAIMVT
jgi:hypothetical protein